MPQLTITVSALLATAVMGCARARDPARQETTSIDTVVKHYASIAYDQYHVAYQDAVEFNNAVRTFTDSPGKDTHKAAKIAWRKARTSYGQTEVFRFYEGPIDAPATDINPEGPEGRLNAWPLNEAYIDYVRGNPNAGIIQQGLVPITEHELTKRNATDDEADVTTGYHAVEFLLWGQDMNPDGPGQRPVSDFQGDTPAVQRRRAYLRAVSSMIVNDLRRLVDAWNHEGTNYRSQFESGDPHIALGHILTGLATLAAFELATERTFVALDSRSQEDEQSCFSDNTLSDHRANLLGIQTVYLRTGLERLIRDRDAELADRISGLLTAAEAELGAITLPFDQVIMGPDDAPDRQRLEAFASHLVALGKELERAGLLLGVEVTIAAE